MEVYNGVGIFLNLKGLYLSIFNSFKAKDATYILRMYMLV